MRWCITVIPALWRMKQEDWKFQATSLRSCLKKKKKGIVLHPAQRWWHGRVESREGLLNSDKRERV
jgi:hypothetical protein